MIKRLMMIYRNKTVSWGVLAAAFLFLSGCTGLGRDLKPMGNEPPAVQVRIDGAPVIQPSPEEKGAAQIPEVVSKGRVSGSPAMEKGERNAVPPGVVTGKRSVQKKRDFAEVESIFNTNGKKRENKQPASPGGISFNFDNADLYEVIRTMAELLSINYIVDPNVRGAVTIHTAGELNRSDLFPLFFQILEANGLTAVKEGELYKIITKSEVTKTPLFARYGRELKDVPSSEAMVMQIVPLKFVSVTGISDVISPFLSDTGSILPQKDSRIIIVVDKSSNMKRILQLVDAFDVDVFDHMEHRFFRLVNMEAKKALSLLNDIVAPYLGIKGSECKLISVERINTIVAISDDARVLDKIAQFVKKIDAQEDSNDARIFIYRVRNNQADELASLLNQVFSKNSDSEKFKKEKFKPGNESSGEDKKVVNPLFIDLKPKKVPQAGGSGFAGSSNLSEEVRIIPDVIRNVLIIEATPSDYLAVERILTQLDVLPKQVLIDVFIAEVTLTDDLKLGVEWDFLKNRKGGDSGLLRGHIGAKEVNFTAGIADDWTAALSALATDDKVNLLSAPSVLASDNKSANINIATQIPITTSSYDPGDGVTTTSVQYRDTGIILTVTPHINDNGMVSMEISQEVSNQVESSASEANPSFFKRSVDTYLTVQDSQSIVIGGLISEKVSDVKSGVPWLSTLPVIGFLFGKNTDTNNKTELVILITPHVIQNLDDIENVSMEFVRKIKGLKDNKRLINYFSEK